MIIYKVPQSVLGSTVDVSLYKR